MGGGDEGALRVKIWSIVLPVHGINAGGGGGHKVRLDEPKKNQEGGR